MKNRPEQSGRSLVCFFWIPDRVGDDNIEFSAGAGRCGRRRVRLVRRLGRVVVLGRRMIVWEVRYY